MTPTRAIVNDDDDEDDADDKGGDDQTDGDVADAMRWTRGYASDGHQTWIV